MSVIIHHGDCRSVLATMPADSVHCCVTSPPYFGLRSYLRDDDPLKHLELGLEAAPDEFIANMVAVFREVRRVLRDDGTLWLNIGDSYAGSGRGGNPTRESSTLQGSNVSQEASMIARRGSRLPAGKHETPRHMGAIGRAWVPPPFGVKQKDLIGIPWMLAFALRADGWYLRQEIIWSKPNPMPESVRDRCTKAHESIFLLSKTPRYFYDAEAITEPVSPNTHARLSQNVMAQVGSERAHAGGKTNGPMRAVGRKRADPRSGIRANDSFQSAVCLPVERRNKRSVWEVANQPYKEAHFATFPPALIEPCILAGCPAGGTVLDPFGGSGTTGMVAQKLGRGAVLIDLNRAYQPMMERRLRTGNVGLPLGTAA